VNTRRFSLIQGWLGGLTLLVLGMALAGSLLAVPARAAEVRLPNLVADPPAGISLETSTTEGGLKKEGTPQLLLRFNGYIHNLGPGPVDFRGSRSSASEPMKAFQRVYSSDGSFKEEPSAAELVYSSADGHEHWHLQRAAKYSLWNFAKSAEVAPAMKVGFCLDDSEHVESGVGPSEKVYADSTGREFCRQHQPEATSLFEGISAGWRDLYSSGLAFQWVDASSVLPGEYFLREDVNTTGAIKEAGGANVPAYTTSPVVIPGFNALPGSFSTASGASHTVTLTSKAFKDAATPTYKILSGPAHGTLGAVSKNQVTYTPAAGYSGPDSFTFAASDPSSPFPRSPTAATVSIEVNAPPPSPGIAIATAPSTLVAGTSGPLSAVVSNDTGGVEWSATEGGAVAPEGTEGLTASLKAPAEPPAGGTVTVTASLRDDPEVRAQATVAVSAAPRPAVSIASAPVAVLAGTSAQLTAAVENDTGGVEWSATAGTIVPGGPEGKEATYTAPAEPPAGGTVTVTARLRDHLGSPATATITVTPTPQPMVAIVSSPTGMTAATSAPLTATAQNDLGGVEWSATAGTIVAGGAEGTTAIYTAPAEPPANGTVTVTARLRDHPTSAATATIAVTRAALVQAAPSLPLAPGSPPAGGTLGSKTEKPALRRPGAALLGRRLILSTLSNVAGRLRLSAYLGRRRLGTCVSVTPSGRSFTCRISLVPDVPLNARIKVIASLRAGRLLLQSVRSASPVPQLKMGKHALRASMASAAWQFWCEPSALATARAEQATAK
jgi:hypothetical protein